MMVAGPSFFSLLMMLLGGQAGVPLSLPPLPEDPVMARIAPAECIWYLSWSGVAEPNPQSSNQTEQLLAEPEVRDFVRGVGTALSAAIRKGAPPTPQGRFLGAEGPHLIYALLTHPAAAFIAKAGIGPRGLDIESGIVVGTGDETEKIKSTLEKLEATLLARGHGAANLASKASQNQPASGGAANPSATWHRLPSSRGAPTIEWGFRGKYLIVGVGDGSADAISARTTGQVPEWLAAIKRRLPIERVSTLHYLNVKKAIATAGPFLGLRGPLVLQALGLDKVEAFANVSGLDAHGCVSKTFVQTDAEPSGLLTLLGPEPLSTADLVPIPKDASLAIAARVHPDKVWSTILESVNKIDANAGDDLAAGIKQMEAVLEFRLQEDLLQTLGDAWCIYNSPGEGGLLITGLTMVVPVKDHDRLVKTNEKLVSAITSMNLSGSMGSPRFAMNTTAFRNQTIFWLRPLEGGMPFALSWCITDKQLILSLSPQNIRAFVSRNPSAGSLADLPGVAAKFKSVSENHPVAHGASQNEPVADGSPKGAEAGAPVLLTYQDTAGILKITYPIAQIFATVTFSELQREGLDLDAAMLPSLASLIRHVEPATSTLSREKDGLLFVSRRSMPIDATMSVLLPMSATMFLVRSARAAEMQQAELRAQLRALHSD